MYALIRWHWHWLNESDGVGPNEWEFASLGTSQTFTSFMTFSMGMICVGWRALWLRQMCQLLPCWPIDTRWPCQIVIKISGSTMIESSAGDAPAAQNSYYTRNREHWPLAVHISLGPAGAIIIKLSDVFWCANDEMRSDRAVPGLCWLWSRFVNVNYSISAERRWQRRWWRRQNKNTKNILMEYSSIFIEAVNLFSLYSVSLSLSLPW